MSLIQNYVVVKKACCANIKFVLHYCLRKSGGYMESIDL